MTKYEEAEMYIISLLSLTNHTFLLSHVLEIDSYRKSTMKVYINLPTLLTLMLRQIRKHNCYCISNHRYLRKISKNDSLRMSFMVPSLTTYDPFKIFETPV